MRFGRKKEYDKKMSAKAVFALFCKKEFKINIRISSLALVEEPLPHDFSR